MRYLILGIIILAAILIFGGYVVMSVMNAAMWMDDPIRWGGRDFFGLGFVNAIGTYAVKAYNASAEMADSAKTGLGNAIAKVKDMIDNGVDGQPMIRPILDLSDVEEKFTV